MRQTQFFNGKKKTPNLLLLAFIVLIFFGLMKIYIDNPMEESLEAGTFESGLIDGLEELNRNNLPIIVIDTYGEKIEGNLEKTEVEINGLVRNLTQPSTRYNANFKLYEPDFYGHTSIDKGALPTVESELTMNVRGQSSLKYDKKQYTIRLKDKDRLKNPKELLNMPIHDKWVLNGMYSDKSLMRNYIAYEMGRQVMDYSPNTRFVEVYLKDTEGEINYDDHYIGTYLLTEKIERDKNRVDIDKNSDRYRDASFIIARDKIKAGDIVLRSDWNMLEDDYIIDQYDDIRPRTVFTSTYPSKKNMTDSYEEKIIGYINDFEYSLRSRKFQDRREGYKNYIDTDSFIKYAMINEITKNIDGGEVSTYFYKDIGGPMKAGPLWDFDQSMGNTSVEEVNEATGFRMVDVIWYERLFQDEDFANRYKSMYKRYRNTIWSDENIDKLIDEALIQLGPSIERNSRRWYPDQTKEDYDKEVEELRSFLKERLSWMDKNINLVNRIKENVVE